LGSLSNFFLETKGRFVDRQRRAPRVITVQEINDASANGIDPFQGDNSNFDFMAPPPSYFLWDFAAGVSLKSGQKRFDFRVAAENLLNKSYREYTNRFRYYADDMGRNFIISVKCIF
jgi:iron complex outermembrane receptor protein